MSELRNNVAVTPRVEINLIPTSIGARVMRRRASRVVWSLGLCGFFATGCLFFAARWLEVHSTNLEQLARERGTPVVLLEEEISKLLVEQSAIQAQLDAQREVGNTIPAASLVRAIATRLPNGTVLDRVSLEYANVQGTTRRVRRATKEVEPSRELRGEIAGIATDESDVGRIVDAIGGLTPVSRVALESSRSREFLGRNVREFRVTFAVDLEKRWTLPSMLDQSLAAQATESAAGGEP